MLTFWNPPTLDPDRDPENTWAAHRAARKAVTPADRLALHDPHDDDGILAADDLFGAGAWTLATLADRECPHCGALDEAPCARGCRRPS